MRNRIRSISLKLIILVFFSIAIISISQKNKIDAADAVAQINQTTYTSIDEAFSVANTMNDCTLVLLKDISIDTDYYLEVTGKFQLDLNGHTIFKFFDQTYQTYQIIVVNNSLTMIDSIGSGTITATGLVQDYGCLIENKGTLNVYAGIFNSDGPSFYGIWNNGGATSCINIYDATFQIDEGTGVMNNNGTLSMYGGTIQSKYGIQNASKTIIYEATIHGLEIAISNLNNGIFDFYGGTITSNQYAIQNYGTFSIYGGTIENESNASCVDNLDEVAIFNQYGGSIVGLFNIALNNSIGIMNIYGGSTSGQPAIYCRGVTNIYGGNVYSSGTNKNSLVVDGGTINIYGGRISHNFMIETGSIHAFGGYFQNNSITLSGNFTYKETSDANFKYEVINQTINTEVILISGNGYLTWCSLAEAIANADDHSKIRLLNSKIINTTINIDKKIILLTNGKTLSCDDTVFNITETGKLYLTEDEGLNGNDMIVGGGNVTINNAGEMYFAGGNIKGKNGINNTGSLYVCAGKVISDNDALIVAGGTAAILAGNFTGNTGLHLLSTGNIIMAGTSVINASIDIQIDTNIPQTIEEVRLEIFGCVAEIPYCISYLDFTNDGYIAFCDHTSIGKITLSNESYGVLYDYQYSCAKVVSSEAKINDNIYGSLEVAIAEANKMDNVVVQLLADVTIEEPLKITSIVTLDLNNHTLTSSTTCIEIASYGVLNIIDSSEIKTSKVVGNLGYSINGGAIVGDLAIDVNLVGILNLKSGNLIGNAKAVHNRGGAISLVDGNLFAQQIGIQNESGTICMESGSISVEQTDIIISTLVSNQLKDAILDLSHYTGDALTLKIENITNNYYIAKCEEQLKDILVWENKNYVPWYTLGGIKIHSHQYDDGVITSPTCTSIGYTTFTCLECKESHQDNEVPKASHELTHFDLQDATCTENGLIEYWYCSSCDKNYSDAECSTVATNLVILAKGHDYSTEPTWKWVEFEQATASFKCSRCDLIEAITTTEISKSMKTLPSCAKVGEWEYSASVLYNDQEYFSYKFEEIPLLEHDITNVEPTWEWAADFTATTAVFKCLNCDYVERIKTQEGITQISTVQPDCVNTGKRIYKVTIEFNNQTYTDIAEEIISAYGHNYEEPTWNWIGYEQACATFICKVCNDKAQVTTKQSDIVNYITIPSSCTSTGIRTYKALIDFENRGYSDTTMEEIPALGHYTEHYEAKPATCTEEGNVEYWYCERCQKYFKDDSFKEEIEDIHIPAQGHDYTDVLPIWEWKETAIATFQCKRCNHSEIVRAASSDITSEITHAATCIEEGIRTYTATISFGGKDYQDTNTEIIARISHHLKYNEHVEETCSEEGKVEYWYCVQCQKYFNDKNASQEISDIIIPAKDHDYTDALAKWEWTEYEKAVATFACSQCDHKHQITVSDADIIIEITKPASCTQTGIKTYTAEILFNNNQYIDKKTEDLPMIEHDYTNVTPIWKWSENHTVQATFKCLNCSHYETITVYESNLTKEITKEATCQENGEKSFTATIEFLDMVYTNTHSEKIPMMDHQPSEWIIDKVATTTSTGLKHKSCLICQTKLENGKIEKLVTSEDGSTSYTDNSEGKVIKTVIITDALPPTELKNDVSYLRQELLSIEDEKKISNGEDITLYLEVKSCGKELTDKDKENILQSTTANAIYLDISLNKKIKNEVSKLENIGQTLQLKLVIPTSIRAQDRNYRLVHYHDGVAEVIDCSIDNENWIIEFETDDFSIFAIVYEEGKNASFIIFICTVIIWSLALIGIAYIFIFEKNHTFQNSTLTPMVAPIFMIPTSLLVAFIVGIGVFVVVWGYILFLHLQNRKFLKSTKEEQKESIELPIKTEIEEESASIEPQMIYRKSFLEKIIQGNEETKQIYNEAKNEFMTYENVYTVPSDDGETVLAGQKRIAFFTLKESVFQLHLALDSEELINDYPALMIGSLKDNEYYSCCVMVEGQADLVPIKAIITYLMQSLDIPIQLNYQYQDFLSLYSNESTELSSTNIEEDTVN